MEKFNKLTLISLIPLYFLLLSVNFSVALKNNFEIKHSISNDSVILGEIIANFLINYFSNDQIFVSILLPLTEGHQQYFQEDLFDHLFYHPELTECSFCILNKMHNTTGGYENTLNIILVNNSLTLS